MPKIKINGTEVDAPEGANLLKVCLEQGAFVPHYCWHPGLSPAGNCRMCLVKVSTSRKLETACMYPCSEGLEVTTEGPEVEAGRKAVLEYMLINHPLDCPICDKAGECDLQDFTYTYRGGVSRFTDRKVVRHTKDLGPNIRIWGSRCINCTRCIRFCDEITGTGELGIVNRGDKSVVDVFPGIPIDNPLSLNVVDICPVGALNDRSFLYQARVWFTDRTKSICPSCSRGCNITITSHDNAIKRLQPRTNLEVNGYWMCDEGRMNVKYVSEERRLRAGKGSLQELASMIREKPFAAVVSAYQTIEELHLIRKLGIKTIGLLALERGEPRKFPGGFVINADKTPNRAGAVQILGEEAASSGLKKVIEELQGGAAKGLLVLNGIPDLNIPEKLVAAAKKAEFVAVSDILPNPLVELADVVIPGSTWAEKDGTYMNADRRIQRIRKAVNPPGGVRSELQWLQEIAGNGTLSAEGIFREAVEGMDYAKVGTAGAGIDDR
jgi:NADH-quinone oxidoreductase subunit G